MTNGIGKGKVTNGKGKRQSNPFSSSTDFRLERGDAARWEQVRSTEVRFEGSRNVRRRLQAAEGVAGAVEAENQPGQWYTAVRRWPPAERIIGFVYRNVLQVKRSGRWIVPVTHLEAIRTLRRLGWTVYVISHVGTWAREQSAAQEFADSDSKMLWAVVATASGFSYIAGRTKLHWQKGFTSKFSWTIARSSLTR